MSTIAKKYLKQALRSYLEDDDATRLGAYRDALTDLMRMAMKDRFIMQGAGNDPFIHLKTTLIGGAYGVFLEESENAEFDRIVKIKSRNLIV